MSESSTLVSYDVRDGVGVITLTNAPANAYSYAMMCQLDEVILGMRVVAPSHIGEDVPSIRIDHQGRTLQVGRNLPGSGRKLAARHV